MAVFGTVATALLSALLTLTDSTFADRLRALARAEHVTFVDLLPSLRARRDHGLYFPEDGHWSPAGHAHVAHVVARALERKEGS
jgi:thioesterase domain-containing protein